MTSWNRGNDNENKGERLMESDELGDKAKGVALKTVGEVEQGINNVQDKLTGKQKDWQGKERTDKPRRTRSRTSKAKKTSRAKKA
jgi:hypothetical protein